MLFYLETIDRTGHRFAAMKYYWCASGTIFFYDYLLTLGDEIKYVWSERKSLGFWLFILNRYFPVTYQLWQFVVSYSPQSTKNTEVCEKTSFYPAVSFFICTLLAQVVLTLRIYAVTMGNVPITAGFTIVTVGQLIFGVYVLVALAKTGAESIPPIPLDPYHICLLNQLLGLEGVYVGIPLLFDLSTFTVTLFFVVRSKKAGFGASILLKTIAEDATRYFFFIFTFQLILVMDMAFYGDGSGSQFLSTLCFSNLVYLPVMVSRLSLSLRKAVNFQRTEQSPTGGGSLSSMAFADPQRSREPGADDIPLHTYRSAQGTSC